MEHSGISESEGGMTSTQRVENGDLGEPVCVLWLSHLPETLH